MKTMKIVSDDYEGHVDYTRHASRGIIIKDGKILLSHLTKQDKYLFPGGGVDEGENYLECLIREIKEETGLIVSANKPFLETYEYFYWDKNWEHIQLYYECKILEETDNTNLTKNEIDSGCVSVWIDFNEAMKIFGSYETIEDKAKAGLYKREYIALEEYLKTSNQ